MSDLISVVGTEAIVFAFASPCPDCGLNYCIGHVVTGDHDRKRFSADELEVRKVQGSFVKDAKL